jgi:outer membrane lipoprotein-sorting protein
MFKHCPVNLSLPSASVPALFVGLLALSWATGVHGAPDALTLLARAAAAENSVALQGQRTIELYERGRRHSTVQQRVARASGGRERIETTSNGNWQGRLAVCDGKTLWEYYPRERRCVKHTLPSNTEQIQQRSLKRVAAQLKARVLGTTQVLSRPAHQILVTNPAGQKVREAWVDAATFVELETDNYLPGGGLGSRTYFTAIDFRPKLAASLFSFQVPAGVQVEAAPSPSPRLSLSEAEHKAGFQVLLPSYLPSGYALYESEAGVMDCAAEGPVVWLQFGNGLDSFSLFQGRCQTNQPCGSTRSVHRWQAGGLTLTLVGQMERSEAERIKASLRAR